MALAVIPALMFHRAPRTARWQPIRRYDRQPLREVWLKRAPSESVLQKAAKQMPDQRLKGVNETAAEMWGRNEEGPDI
jgi:hypothetical protein